MPRIYNHNHILVPVLDAGDVGPVTSFEFNQILKTHETDMLPAYQVKGFGRSLKWGRATLLLHDESDFLRRVLETVAFVRDQGQIPYGYLMCERSLLSLRRDASEAVTYGPDVNHANLMGLPVETIRNMRFPQIVVLHSNMPKDLNRDTVEWEKGIIQDA